MEKSHILDEQQIDRAVRVAVKHVKSWTRQQLQKILSESRKTKSNPLIVQLAPTAYIIGNYALRQVGQEWHMIYRYSDDELVFSKRNAAMFYAIFQQTKREHVAEQILKYDENISRLNIKVENFRSRLQQKRMSSGQRELYSNRLLETKLQLQRNQFLLEKTLNIAKYINF